MQSVPLEHRVLREILARKVLRACRELQEQEVRKGLLGPRVLREYKGIRDPLEGLAPQVPQERLAQLVRLVQPEPLVQWVRRVLQAPRVLRERQAQQVKLVQPVRRVRQVRQVLLAQLAPQEHPVLWEQPDPPVQRAPLVSRELLAQLEPLDQQVLSVPLEHKALRGILARKARRVYKVLPVLREHKVHRES